MRQQVGRKDAPLRLSDDILARLWPVLGWVSTTNPAFEPAKPSLGLNTYGVTVIEGEGARKLGAIAAALRSLVSEAPDPIELPPVPISTVDDGGNEVPLGVEIVLVERASLLRDLSTLIDLATQAQEEGAYLFHCGV